MCFTHLLRIVTLLCVLAGVSGCQSTGEHPTSPATGGASESSY